MRDSIGGGAAQFDDSLSATPEVCQVDCAASFEAEVELVDRNIQLLQVLADPAWTFAFRFLDTIRQEWSRQRRDARPPCLGCRHLAGRELPGLDFKCFLFACNIASKTA